ncbi:SDR family oxidoreductase [Longimicrobium terrae]|uniref:NAD(P)-dependent dehydrogenase (Short-subunit alcohol dehydrogenase family) n=1 Tax=Longimicrobium terrae TaxID=1639882 RepID=A0A841GZY4_9BACT|nr:SDR family oxidoreductase [Longimicrobium terrae]MBB4636727.1 NAD(P)-dependent dehydrogenase (short-subunit alcohol dehydrogenase family) [Longimicrobium terrae]MBB6071274.1 NAD(P)-dependent dehydrogenase (short-subunit alcohol dehydrogenase family) [Longimicrobium terrae]
MTDRSMKGRVCVITGATAGIGQATAAGLAQRGATVVLVARSRDKARASAEEIIRATGNERVQTVIADLSVQAQVRAAASEIADRFPAIHVLVNNAGMYTRRREVTADGIEMQLAVNHLAPFLLTNLLLDRLRAGAPARVVNVSSDGHKGGRIRWDDPGMANGYGGLRAYANTKLMNILFTRELARREDVSVLTANALHPGVVGTSLLFGGFAPISLFKRFLRTPEQGAATSIHLASSPAVAKITGGYFKDEKPIQPSAAARDDDASRRLWALSEQLTGLAPR